MHILAFDTCFGAVSVAVAETAASDDVVVRAERFEPMGKGHAERLMPLIQETLQDAGIGFGDLSKLAVTLGPGGFTGLRAGIAAARGLALATGLPVVGATSLAVMARGMVREAGPVGVALVVIQDARRDEVYLQAFTGDGKVALAGARLASVADAARLLPPGRIVVAGSGAEAVLTSAGRDDARAILPALEPHAADLARMAATLAPLATVTPLYLREADAKVQTANVLPRVAS